MWGLKTRLESEAQPPAWPVAVEKVTYVPTPQPAAMDPDFTTVVRYFAMAPGRVSPLVLDKADGNMSLLGFPGPRSPGPKSSSEVCRASFRLS